MSINKGKGGHKMSTTTADTKAAERQKRAERIAEHVYALAHEMPNDPEDGEWSQLDRETIAQIAAYLTDERVA